MGATAPPPATAEFPSRTERGLRDTLVLQARGKGSEIAGRDARVLAGMSQRPTGVERQDAFPASGPVPRHVPVPGTTAPCGRDNTGVGKPVGFQNGRIMTCGFACEVGRVAGSIAGL